MIFASYNLQADFSEESIQALLHYGDAIDCSNEITVDESYIHAWQNRAVHERYLMTWKLR